MTWQTWLTYLAAVLLLMSTPGPSQLLMMSNSMANGFRRSLATAAGDLSANILQMLAAGIGLGAVVVASETAFSFIKWLGVAYLVWMGVEKWRTAGRGKLGNATTASVRSLYLQGFVTSAANPKAVVFFAALFPQFISSHSPFWPQYGILSVTYVSLDALFLTVYGSSAGWIAERLSAAAKANLDRVSGGFLITAAVLLGLKSASRS